MLLTFDETEQPGDGESGDATEWGTKDLIKEENEKEKEMEREKGEKIEKEMEMEKEKKKEMEKEKAEEKDEEVVFEVRRSKPEDADNPEQLTHLVNFINKVLLTPYS